MQKREQKKGAAIIYSPAAEGGGLWGSRMVSSTK